MIKKIIVAAVLLTAILVGGTGCMFSNQQSFRELALSFMEEKYDEDFTFVSSWGASYANKGIQEILVKSESLSGNILVRGVKNGKSYIFSDNYLAVKYKDEMTSAIKDVSDMVFGESTVFYQVMPQALSTELPADASFEEYSTASHSGVVASVAVPANAFDISAVEEYAQQFQKTGITASIQLLVTDEETYSAMNAAEFDSCITNGRYQYCAIIHISKTGIAIYPGEDS